VKILSVIAVCLCCSFQSNAQMHHSDQHSSAQNFYMHCMNDMMHSMQQQSSAVSPDIDFLQQMIVHHKGAIWMANYEIIHGKNKEMIQLAKSILYEQSSEINMMQLWLNTPLKHSSVPGKYTQAMNTSMDKMMDDMMMDSGKNYDNDKAFASTMLPHHAAAVGMAKVIMLYSSNEQVTSFAKQLISNEQIEIEQMLAFIK
jgi:uncharacterized protein (DUF305 family)